MDRRMRAANQSRRNLGIPFLVLVLIAGTAVSAERVEILKDEYGVPHIFAATARGAAYASGYLQASDRADELLRHLHRSSAERHDAELSPAVQALVAAYCAGITAWFQEHPAGSNTAPSVEPWMVVDYSAEAARAAQRGNSAVLNADRTASRQVIAIIDPLSEWADAPYQMVIASAEYNWVGAAPVGLPFPLEGHGFATAVTARERDAGFRTLDVAWARQTAAPGPLAQELPGPSQAGEMTREQLDFNGSVTIYDAVRIATSTDVFKAGEWQKRIARADPDSPFTRMITGWSRRSDYNSAGALAYYLFKRALGPPESAAVEPPDSLSDNRIRAALHRARDQMETQFPYQAAYGTLFRVPAGARSFPASGGTVTEAGMETPRRIRFMENGSTMLGVYGQSATQIVELVQPVPKSFMLIPAEGSPEKFARGETQPTYFGDRRELEKHVKARQVLLTP